MLNLTIADLDYLSEMSDKELEVVAGGEEACSLDYNLENGVVSVKTGGGPLQTIKSKAGSTTYICKDGTSDNSITVGDS